MCRTNPAGHRADLHDPGEQLCQLLDPKHPNDVIEKLLKENPEIVGLALPGMPPGVPGMGGEPQGPLEILAFDQQGQVWVYTTWQ